MSTNFSDLHDFVWAILGDNDSSNRQYSSSVLNTHIRLLVLGDDDYDEVGETAVFDSSLTDNQKALLSYRTAKSIISNVPDHFSYKTAVLSVVRKGAIKQLLAHIDEMINAIEGGAFAVSIDTFIHDIVNYRDRYLDEYNDA